MIPSSMERALHPRVDGIFIREAHAAARQQVAVGSGEVSLLVYTSDCWYLR